MSLKELLLDELKDLYDAEQQLTRALSALADAAGSDGLRSAFESHLEETQNHARRLEDVFVLLGVRPARKHCDAVADIVPEGARIIGNRELAGALKDAALIAAVQKAEHYEMAGYGTVAAWARTLGLIEVASCLEQSLEEEKAADQALSDLAEQEVNISAAQKTKRT